MKHTAVFLSFILLIVSCNTKGSTPVTSKRYDTTSLLWQDTLVKLGNIKAEQEFPLTFKFKNTGNRPLVFEKVESTCGCTVVNKGVSKPVLPGKSDSITATLKTYNLSGRVSRKIYVLANTTKEFYVLNLQADVSK